MNSAAVAILAERVDTKEGEGMPSQKSIRAAREAFIASGLETSGIRPATLAAWRRSKAAGVAAGGTPTLRVDDEIDPDSSLLRAVRPVTEELLQEFTASDVAMMVTDRDARIVGRWTSGRLMARHMDRMGVFPGTVFEEALVGSTGLGTVLEAASPIVVDGAEHYNDSFDAVVAVGAPIIHPGTGVVEGVVDLVAPTGAPVGLMLPLVSRAVREAGNRLVTGYAREDRELLDAFMQIERRGPRRPMIALNSRIVMANAHTGDVLGHHPHALLWDEVSRSIAEGRELVRIGGGTDAVLARIRKVSRGEGGLGAVLQILPEEAAGTTPGHLSSPARSLSVRVGHLLPGRSLRWTHAIDTVAQRLLDGGRPVLLTGPPGVGKSVLARTAVDRWAGESVEHVAAAELVRRCDTDAATEPGAALVVDRVELLDPTDVDALVEIVDAWSTRRRPVMLMWQDPENVPVPAGLVDRADVVELPSLAHRPHDIGDLIQAWSRRREDGGCAVDVDVIRDLMRRMWPGNVRELFQTLDIAASNRTGPRIVADDIPTPDRVGPRRRLTFLESVEREAIAKLLDAAGGRKVEVARELGISRSTLYRKLAALGLNE